jgi:predicted ATPase
MKLTRSMDLLGKLSTAVSELCRLHERVMVGIDGPDGAGKTTLADQLANALQVTGLQAQPRQVTTLRASVDGFTRPRAQRYQRGELSAEGYYLDVRVLRKIERRYVGRYLPGQALYRRRADPEGLADIRVDNERHDAPRIERWSVKGVTLPA